MATEAWGENGVMRPCNYEVLFDVEGEHWWFVGRRAIVSALLEQALGASLGAQASLPAGAAARAMNSERLDPQAAQAGRPALPGMILDIGCGTGATLDYLQRYGLTHGVDLSEIPLSFSHKRGHTRVTCASATALPFAADSFDLITALDVVEHLDDDVAGLREIRRTLKPGGAAIIFVPAFQALWGPNDDQSGHKRRYRLPQFQAALVAAGLRVERLSYANIAMFAPIWLGRRLLTLSGRTDQAENRINHPLINGLLARVFASEAGWLKNHTLPFGVSIICLARK